MSSLTSRLTLHKLINPNSKSRASSSILSPTLSSSPTSTSTNSVLLNSNQKRFLAVPVNRSSSVDSSFGSSPPAPPSHDSLSSPSLRTKTPIGAQVRGDPFPNQHLINQESPPSAWGRGLGGKPPLPPSNSNPIGASNHYQSANQSSKDQDIDREHPHSAEIGVPDQNGNFNTLDSKILKAAQALLKQEREQQSSLSSSSSSSSSQQQRPSNLQELLYSFSTKANHQLPFSLPYEPTPKKERKVPLTNAKSTKSEIQAAKEDGVVLVAYIDGLNLSFDSSNRIENGISEPKISVCSGFAIEGRKMLEDKGEGKGELLITCAHTLRSCMPRSPSNTSTSTSTSTSSTNSSLSSLGLVMTRTGRVYRIHSLLSSLPTSDLILLQLSEKSISLDDSVSSLDTDQELRTLPLSPYPSPIGTELCVSSFSGWENDEIANAMGKVAAAFSSLSSSSSSNELTSDSSSLDSNSTHSNPNPNFSLNPMKESLEAEERARARGRWGRAKLIEYKDPSGREAKVGTYDELSQLEFKILIDSHKNPSTSSSTTTTSSSSFSPLTPPTSSNQNLEEINPNSNSNSLSTSNENHNLTLFSTLSNFPPPGSSGGPVVESNTGAVVGVVRGTKMSALEGRRGDAIPAEKIFEFFALPGIGSNKL